MFACGWGARGVKMGVGCPCPPVRNDMVTPRNLFLINCFDFIIVYIFCLTFLPLTVVMSFLPVKRSEKRMVYIYTVKTPNKGCLGTCTNHVFPQLINYSNRYPYPFIWFSNLCSSVHILSFYHFSNFFLQYKIVVFSPTEIFKTYASRINMINSIGRCMCDISCIYNWTPL